MGNAGQVNYSASKAGIVGLTKTVAKHAEARQGVAMGLNNSFNSLGRVVGPIWAGFLFDFDYNYPYLSGAAIMCAAFLGSLVWVSQERKEPVVKGDEKSQ